MRYLHHSIRFNSSLHRKLRWKKWSNTYWCADGFVFCIITFRRCLRFCKINSTPKIVIGKQFFFCSWLRKESDRKEKKWITNTQFLIQCQWYIVSTIISTNSLFVIDSIVLMPMNLYRNQFLPNVFLLSNFFSLYIQLPTLDLMIRYNVRKETHRNKQKWPPHIWIFPKSLIYSLKWIINNGGWLLVTVCCLHKESFRFSFEIYCVNIYSYNNNNRNPRPYQCRWLVQCVNGWTRYRNRYANICVYILYVHISIDKRN